MNWIIFALLSPAVYAIVNFTDKYIVEKEVKDYRGLPIYTSILSFIVGLILWIVNGYPVLHYKDILLSALTGTFSVFSLVVYFKALAYSETSKIIVLFQLIPILILTLSVLFLHETITLIQFIGFIIVLISTLAVSGFTTKNIRKALNLSSAFFLILIYDLLASISTVISKYILIDNSFLTFISYELWGISIGGIVLFTLSSSIRQAFFNTIRCVSKRALG